MNFLELKSTLSQLDQLINPESFRGTFQKGAERIDQTLGLEGLTSGVQELSEAFVIVEFSIFTFTTVPELLPAKIELFPATDETVPCRVKLLILPVPPIEPKNPFVPELVKVILLFKPLKISYKL